jgi:hypothetical protein
MEPTWDEWWAMDEDARAVVVDHLLERIPSGYVDSRAVGHRGEQLPQFIHHASNTLFHAVFGGEALVGMSDERLARIDRVVRRDPEEDLIVPLVRPDEVSDLRPARRVQVPTCLVADEPLAWGQLVKLGLDEAKLGINGVSPVAVGALLGAVTRFGWRAPSEAEWEYACRCVEDEPGAGSPPSEGTGRLLGTGLSRLGDYVELCADDWHDDFNGAPVEPRWGRGHDVLRGRGRGREFVGWQQSAAWGEAVWPGRRRLATWPRTIAFRPWVDLAP